LYLTMNRSTTITFGARISGWSNRTSITTFTFDSRASIHEVDWQWSYDDNTVLVVHTILVVKYCVSRCSYRRSRWSTFSSRACKKGRFVGVKMYFILETAVCL
uniref:PKD_channel domain-containing protein n=1 Tax=Haemonchus placei TaxID=6290 RepID=A0A0N4VVS6_HAEPC